VRVATAVSASSANRPSTPSPKNSRNSAELKSSVNQPVMVLPSTTLVVLRLANSGWLATSVVAVMSFSCRATSTWFLVETRSGSMKSAPISMASR
jgi:hypothetical protein